MLYRGVLRMGGCRQQNRYEESSLVHWSFFLDQKVKSHGKAE
jgi:hypothetical protein